ncbi:ester cyclase [Virgibacillus sp. DJP39]|uniref:nuclear transport factor 2 family protein n=1 Tax=Virgibacillus sp. DJP39 TaxID=3409790 RepID=UPI003BB542C6
MGTEQQFTTDMSLKEIAVTFLQLVASGKVREAYQRYISPDFCHHNPYFSSDAESLMVGMEENAAETPEKVFEVKLAIQENDSVMVHSLVKQNPDDLGGAVVHIFRFQDNKIVELWDVGQPIPKDSPNEKGMF